MSKDINDCEQSRYKFNKYYNNAVIDVLSLKNDRDMNIKEIHDTLTYDINFIIHVLENYDMHVLPKVNNNDETKYNLSVKVNEYNINIEKLKEAGYSDALIADVLNPSEEGTIYYYPI
jgi:hypothetical protein